MSAVPGLYCTRPSVICRVTRNVSPSVAYSGSNISAPPAAPKISVSLPWLAGAELASAAPCCELAPPLFDALDELSLSEDAHEARVTPMAATSPTESTR